MITTWRLRMKLGPVLDGLELAFYFLLVIRCAPRPRSYQNFRLRSLQSSANSSSTYHSSHRSSCTSSTATWSQTDLHRHHHFRHFLTSSDSLSVLRFPLASACFLLLRGSWCPDLAQRWCSVWSYHCLHGLWHRDWGWVKHTIVELFWLASFNRFLTFAPCLGASISSRPSRKANNFARSELGHTDCTLGT